MGLEINELIDLIKLEAKQLYQPQVEYGYSTVHGSRNDMKNRISVLRKNLTKLNEKINEL